MILVRRADPADVWLKNGPHPSWRGCVSDGKRTANMSCPNGHVASLSDHDIAPDGTVTPSLVCPGGVHPDQNFRCPTCNFHDYVRLDGWASSHRGPETGGAV